MTSSTVIAISTAQSSAAMAAAARAEKKACEGVVSTFDAKGASIDAMKVYADCVNLLYPDPMTDFDTGMLKLCLILCFIGGAFGAVYGWKEDGPVYSALFFVMGFAITFGVLFILALLIMALGFVVGVI